jgi:histidyl-tRNA synthetase
LSALIPVASEAGSETGAEIGSGSMQRLQAIYEIAKDIGIENNIVIDPSITRGLDYYTGFVCETFIVGYEDMGSVCSGGRYNNLTQMFDEEQCPGVGASIGLDRLLAVLEEMGDMNIHTFNALDTGYTRAENPPLCNALCTL